MYPKSISNINLVVIGEEKYFSIFSKAINGGCLPDVYWDVECLPDVSKTNKRFAFFLLSGYRRFLNKVRRFQL